MYNCLFHLYITGTHVPPWITFIQQILDGCGFSYIWLEQRRNNVTWVKLEVERSIFTVVASWTPEDVIMWLYYHLKDEFKFEKYLLCGGRRYSQAICNFRVSNNRTPKITGRYKGLERNKGFCTLCNNNYPGGKYHVLYERKNTSIVDNRRKYLPNYSLNQPTSTATEDRSTRENMENMETRCTLNNVSLRVLKRCL